MKRLFRENFVKKEKKDQIELVINLEHALGMIERLPSQSRKAFNYEAQIAKIEVPLIASLAVHKTSIAFGVTKAKFDLEPGSIIKKYFFTRKDVYKRQASSTALSPRSWRSTSKLITRFTPPYQGRLPP